MDRHHGINLTEGVIWTVLLKFTLPIFLGILFQSFYATVDAVIIGRFAGKNALAAIESVFLLVRLPVNFFTGLASAATIIVSQHFGAGQYDHVAKASHNAVLFSFAGGGIAALLAARFSPLFIQMVNVPAEIQSAAHSYLLITFSGMAVLMLYNMGSGIIRAIGNSKAPFYFLVIGNCCNVILDLIFIAVLHMGIKGAAAATVLSQLISAVLVMRFLIRTDSPCRIYLKKLRFYKDELKSIFTLGLPIAIQSTLFPVSNIIVQSSINTFGVNHIAAWAVCGKLDFLIWYISEAFGISVTTFSAQNHGAGKGWRIRASVTSGLAMSLSLVACCSAGLYLFSRPLSAVLVNDPAVIATASETIMFLAPFYSLYVFCEIFPGAIKGTGETFRPMLVTLVCTCLSRVIWVTFLPEIYRTFKMTLLCYPFSWALTGTVFAIYYAIWIKKAAPADSPT